MVSLKHKFTSPKADGTDSTFVKPSNWNAEHDLIVTQPSVLGTLVAGPVAELPLHAAASGEDGSMYTKAAVDAAIAAAIAGLPANTVDTGDLCSSLAATKANWLLLNGQTIGNAGSGATYAATAAQALFTLLWGINGGTWPIINGRGASAAADWASTAPFKQIAIPDARGRVLGMLDLSAGVNTLIANLGMGVGEQNHVMTQGEMPAHQHGMSTVQITNLGGVGSGTSLWFSSAHSGPNPATDVTGGDGLSPPSGIGGPHNNVQPTMGVNYFIKL